MNKDKRGRPQKKVIKEKVKALRIANYSFTEIAKTLNISRQLAFYHTQKLSTVKPIDKD